MGPASGGEELTSSHADFIVKSELVPVSESGTGNTLATFILPRVCARYSTLRLIQARIIQASRTGGTVWGSFKYLLGRCYQVHCPHTGLLPKSDAGGLGNRKFSVSLVWLPCD